MKIMYTCDDNYIWLLGISAISLFENNKSVKELEIYVIGNNISNNSKLKLNEISNKYSRKIIVIEMPKIDIPKALISSRWPISAFARLFAPEILPENVDKILYLDCDTIILNDISELDQIDMKNNVILGVADSISAGYKKNIGLDRNSLYINAGVLLMNIKEMRKEKTSNNIESFMKEYSNTINYADQDILNGVFNKKIGELHPKYNHMTINAVNDYKEILVLRRPTGFYDKNSFEEASVKPSIVHFTTYMNVIRPWFKNSNHPFYLEFQKYKECSPWKENRLEEMHFKSFESKIIRVITLFPKKLSYYILGLLHAKIKPLYIKMRLKK